MENLIEMVSQAERYNNLSWDEQMDLLLNCRCRYSNPDDCRCCPTQAEHEVIEDASLSFAMKLAKLNEMRGIAMA